MVWTYQRNGGKPPHRPSARTLPGVWQSISLPDLHSVPSSLSDLVHGNIMWLSIDKIMPTSRWYRVQWYLLDTILIAPGSRHRMNLRVGRAQLKNMGLPSRFTNTSPRSRCGSGESNCHRF